jgi:hypothetical protein
MIATGEVRCSTGDASTGRPLRRTTQIAPTHLMGESQGLTAGGEAMRVGCYANRRPPERNAVR